ncbi:hypothetical protein GQ53DRAFT_777638 [Thozetella sp. PMI_491]|nr:hypothetical protein GQ53DRAFT_777638 [Thozetella sp. PMI_491]
MSGPPPPPPPPHGENPKTTAGGGPNLPSGKYDIFIIPEHSAGSGFLYLPSLKPQWNSFIAGVACTLAVVVMGNSLAPALRAWWASFQGIGNMGVFLLMVAIGLGAWSLGRQGVDGPGGSTPGSGQTPRGGGSDWSAGGGFGGANGNAQPPPNAGPPPHQHAPPPPPPPPPPQPETPRPERPQPSWQSGQTRAETPKTNTPKGAWEKAREETRQQKRREEAARRLRELREREAREREAREKDARERKEAQEKARLEKEKSLKEAREKLEREMHEKTLREAREREAREREERLKKEQEDSRKGSTYAYSAVGEKTNMWPNGKPPAASTAPPPAASSTKPPPQPTAKTYVDTEEDAYSFRPYDKPKKPPVRKKSVSDFSETSWAPSASTARTSPPPSIVIRATPASQLVSGVGTVTDGLILRITSAGLFVDDDVRGVAQREWDVKAWTLKLIEVWCPTHVLASASASAPGAAPANHPFFKSMPGMARSRAAERNVPKTFTGDDAVAYLDELGSACEGGCRLGAASKSSGSSAASSSFASARSSAAASSVSDNSNATDKTGEWTAKGLHLMRATIRDQEGKRYLFVIGEEESWKIAKGLQTLRGGTQVRALGVSSFSAIETKNILETLGWGG